MARGAGGGGGGQSPFAIAFVNSAGAPMARTPNVVGSALVGPGSYTVTLAAPGAGLVAVQVSTSTPNRVVRAGFLNPTTIEVHATDLTNAQLPSDFTIVAWDGLI